MNYKKEMGVRLKERRKEMRMTQEQLSDQLNISIKHYSEVERGITGLSVENIIKISNILHVSIDYLLKGEGKKEEFPYEMILFYQNCSTEQKKGLMQIFRGMEKLARK